MLIDDIVDFCDKNIRLTVINVVARDVTIHRVIAAAIAITACTIFTFQSAPHPMQKHCMIVRKCCITMYANIRTCIQQSCYAHMKKSMTI